MQALRRLFPRRARREASHDVDPPDSRLAVAGHSRFRTEDRGLERQRGGDVRVVVDLQRAGESGRRHADDRENRLIELEGLAEHVRAGAEALPVGVAENDDGVRARVVVLLRDSAPEGQRHAEASVITAGNDLSAHHFGPVVRGGGDLVDRREGEQVGERVRTAGGLRPGLAHLLEDVVEEYRASASSRRPRHARSATSADSERAAGFPFEEHEALGFPDGERFQQNGVQDAEQSGVGADAERERGHRHGREAGVLAQPADRVTDVLDHGAHRFHSARRARIGSIDAARRAGIQQASAAQPASRSATAA